MFRQAFTSRPISFLFQLLTDHRLLLLLYSTVKCCCPLSKTSGGSQKFIPILLFTVYIFNNVDTAVNETTTTSDVCLFCLLYVQCDNR
ncbi:putative FBD-associated F-box protein [Trichinella spiralis]|uniref:FBD-associated F-box protein n=1 Tax=Trichinella spiralis TaxID=6334 RepID=A0ABR3K116_TRISP